MQFSPDGKLISTASQDGTIGLWTSDGKLIRKILLNNKDRDQGNEPAPIWRVQFSPDSQLLAAIKTDDKTVQILDLTGNLIPQLSGHEQPVESIDFSLDGQLISTGSRDSTARLWTLSGDLVAVLAGHSDIVWSVKFSPDGQHIATASEDNTVKVWDLNGNQVAHFKGHLGGVGSVRFTPDGTTLISVGDDRSVRFWDILGNREPTLRGHQNWIEAAEFTPGGQFIVTSSGDGTARVWDLEGNVITEFTEHDGWIHDVSVSSDGLIATAADDFLVKLWDLQGNTISEFRNPESPVWDLAFSPDGQQVALGTSLGIVRILDLQGNVVQDFKAHNDSIWKNNFSPDGKKLGTTAEDGGFRLWSLEGKLLSHSLENQEAVWGFQFSPDGNWLITASKENTLRLLNVDGKLTREFQAHNGEVRDVTFSPDSRYIASASDDTTVRVWDLEGNQLAEFHGHSGPVSSVSFSPDSEFLVTSSYDDTARIWRFRTLDKLLEAGCQWLENYLLTYPSQLLELEVCHTPDLLARASTKLHWEGEQEARRNNRARALRLLQQAQVWNPYLSYDPKTRAEQFYLIGEGETFAQLGEVEEARAFMKRALELDSSLSIDLEARVNRLVTPALLEKADRAIFEEDIETSISAFEQAQALDPEQISDSRWAKLCQSGSLAGYASDVLWACDLAVEKDSFPGRLRSRRGVARALSNDIEGAIDDFEAYINWTYSEGALVFEKKCLEVDRLRRQRWIDALRSGQNPFTPEELEKLR